MRILDSESFFESILVIGIDDAWYAIANKSAGLGIQLDLGGIRNLLYTNDNLHIAFLHYLKMRPEMTIC